MKLSIGNYGKATRGVDFIGRFLLTRVSAEQTEHTSDQYIASCGKDCIHGGLQVVAS